MQHTHRMGLSWWIGGILLGMFCAVIGGGLLFALLAGVPMEHQGLLDYLGLLVGISLLPFGASMIAVPVVTRVVVKPYGIEYHALTLVLDAPWNSLVSAGYSRNPNIGKAWIVVPRSGNLRVRKWARPFPWLFKTKLDQIEIVLCQFRRAEGHELEDDIITNVTHVGPLSDR